MPSEGSGSASAKRRALLFAALVVNLAILGFFKYEGFLARKLNALAGSTLIPDLELPMPLGLSYFTLQAIAYLVDVFRGTAVPCRSLPRFAIHIAAFPQMSMGPIVRYGDIAAQLEERGTSIPGIASGLRRFIVGLAKKVLLADVCAILVSALQPLGPSGYGLIGAWSLFFARAFELYFDFSGYSDMVVGLGRMLGFSYPENFDHPFAAESFVDLWRRWHMSLTSFFRDYVYIPLGGNRRGTARTIANILVVWLLTGLWHGATWGFVLWGLLNGALLVGERFLWGDAFARLPRPIRSLLCTFAFMLTLVFFFVGSAKGIPSYLLALVGGFGISGTRLPWQLTAWEYLPVLVVCIIASTPIAQTLGERFLGADEDAARTDGIARSEDDTEPESSAGFATATRSSGAARFIRDAVLLCLLVCSIAGVVSGTFSPSAYLRF